LIWPRLDKQNFTKSAIKSPAQRRQLIRTSSQTHLNVASVIILPLIREKISAWLFLESFSSREYWPSPSSINQDFEPYLQCFSSWKWRFRSGDFISDVTSGRHIIATSHGQGPTVDECRMNSRWTLIVLVDKLSCHCWSCPAFVFATENWLTSTESIYVEPPSDDHLQLKFWQKRFSRTWTNKSWDASFYFPPNSLKRCVGNKQID
jgi:hypothetical protein